jgi:hypothetical protein
MLMASAAARLSNATSVKVRQTQTRIARLQKEKGMTIEVRIKNKDANRAIEVIEVSIDKTTGRRSNGPPYRVAPGCSTSVHAYLLRDILVREVDPG